MRLYQPNDLFMDFEDRNSEGNFILYPDYRYKIYYNNLLFKLVMCLVLIGYNSELDSGSYCDVGNNPTDFITRSSSEVRIIMIMLLFKIIITVASKRLMKV